VWLLGLLAIGCQPGRRAGQAAKLTDAGGACLARFGNGLNFRAAAPVDFRTHRNQR